MRQFLQLIQRPWARISAAIVVVLLIAFAGGAFYLFGTGHNTASTAGGQITAPTLAPTKNSTIFTINSSNARATFTLNEVLFGNPNTVVGTTHEVAGQIAVNQQDPSQSQVGEIRVDLSTLVTDNDLRNNTIQHRILESDQPANQFATFVTKSLKELPATIALNQAVSFQMTGDLTIHRVTRSVTFTAQVTLMNASTLKGQAQATVNYKDFNITIPDVPSVTSVTDTVQLALTFTATA